MCTCFSTHTSNTCINKYTEDTPVVPLRDICVHVQLQPPLEVPVPPLTTKSRAVCRKHFFTLLGDQKTDNGFEHLYALHAMLQKLMGCKRGVALHGEGAEEWSENKEALTAVQTQLLKSAKHLSNEGKGGSSGETGIRRGMECLLLHVALHQYEHPAQFTQAGTELILCSKDIVSSDVEARGKARAVLIDIVLMLLNETAIADTNMRSAINHSWRLLCYGGDAVVNTNALQELLRVLTLDAKSLYANEEDDSEGEPISDEDEEEGESGEESDEQEVEAPTGDKQRAKDDDEKADDDDDNDDEAEAGDNSEEGEEEDEDEKEGDDDEGQDDDESDADLEARAIATMLRLRREQKRSKAELKQRAIHFKLRVVDLLETFIAVNNKLEQDETRPKPCLPGLLSMLAPLLKATQIVQRQVYAGKGHKEATSLLDRLGSLFNKKLCKAVVKSTRGGKAQHGQKEVTAVVEAMREVLDPVLATPSKAKDTGSAMAGTAIVFLFRVLQTLGVGHEGPVVDGAREQMARVVKCCFLTKNPKFRVKFLELQAVRSPFFAWLTLLPPLSKICSASEGEWCPKSPYQRVQCFALIDLVLKSYRQLFNLDQAVATKLLAAVYEPLCGGVAFVMELCCQDVAGTEGADTTKEADAKYLLKAKRLKVVLKFGNTLLRVWREKLQTAVPPSCFSGVQAGVGRLVALRGPGTAGNGVACRSEKVHGTLLQFGSTLNKAIVTTPVSNTKTPKKRKSTDAIGAVQSSTKKKIKSARKSVQKTKVKKHSKKKK